MPTPGPIPALCACARGAPKRDRGFYDGELDWPAQHLSVVFAIDDILQATKRVPSNDSCQHPARGAPDLAFEI